MNTLVISIVFFGQVPGLERGSVEAAQAAAANQLRVRLEAERNAGAKVLTVVGDEKSDGKATRMTWINESYGTKLYHVKEKEWEESDDKTGRVKWTLTELSRTDEAIELRNEARDQVYRILDKRLELKEGDTWKWLSKGRWEIPVVEAPDKPGAAPDAARPAPVAVEAVAASSPNLGRIRPGMVYEFEGSFEIQHIVDDETMVVSYYFNPSIKLWVLEGFKTKDFADGDMVKLPEPAKVDGTFRWAGNTLRVIRPLTGDEKADGLVLPPSEEEIKARRKVDATKAKASRR